MPIETKPDTELLARERFLQSLVEATYGFFHQRGSLEQLRQALQAYLTAFPDHRLDRK